MRLILLPCDPTRPGGYNRVAAEDLVRLRPTAEDEVLCYVESGFPPPYGLAHFRRPPKRGFRKFLNLAMGRALSDVGATDLASAIRAGPYSEIFCGDVVFYRALRALFPSQPLTVRFHNFFTLAGIRRRARLTPIDTHFWLTLRLTSRLERAICADPSAMPIFINPAELECFRLAWPGRPCELWGPVTVVHEKVRHPSAQRIIYLGGTGSHQRFGLVRFINMVFRPLVSVLPGVELHLWGDGTDSLDDPPLRVFGHGYWQGDGTPHDGDGLFVIPDLLGGGVKIKTGDALRDGRAFITTPFGAEGYDFAPTEGRFVAEMPQWTDLITAYFRRIEAKTCQEPTNTCQRVARAK